MIVYLAAPYTHSDEDVRLLRFDDACRAAAWAMSQGHTCFSPISHSHPIADHLPDELLLDHQFWMDQDLPLLRVANEVWVYMGEGWDKSKGMAREIREAEALGIPVRYVRPEEVPPAQFKEWKE